ncbi:MAG: cbb3-type cytochrome c oxidase subunit I, partial [Gemmatimonadetes bacterium]|nr:cbb3-type cytochrome c oxidase subunit I [Gemmatimonadota bacterium]
VLFGGLILGVFAGFYYWWPKLTGRLLDERLGKWHFWLTFLGFNTTFFPMHFIGLLGMPRRIYTYSSELNLGGLNLLVTVGGFVTALGTLAFLWNLYRSRRHGEPAGPNPWDAPTLEWATTSPPPVYNFGSIPVVRSRQPMWDRPEELGAQARAVPPEAVHMPAPSHWPIFTAAGILLTFALFLAERWWAPLMGLPVVAFGAIRWAFEPQFGSEA